MPSPSNRSPATKSPLRPPRLPPATATASSGCIAWPGTRRPVRTGCGRARCRLICDLLPARIPPPSSTPSPLFCPPSTRCRWRPSPRQDPLLGFPDWPLLSAGWATARNRRWFCFILIRPSSGPPTCSTIFAAMAVRGAAAGRLARRSGWPTLTRRRCLLPPHLALLHLGPPQARHQRPATSVGTGVRSFRVAF